MGNASLQILSEITLKAMQFDASVGILPEERENTQPIEVDLMVWALESEGILDYRALYDLAASVINAGHIDYLEEIGDRIASRLLAEHHAVRTARVAVRKPQVKLGGPLAYAEVVTTRARHGHQTAYIALGSNIGDRAGNLARAREAISRLPHCEIVRESSIEETAPLGPQDQPSYLNQMVAVHTTLSPRDLLSSLLRIERELGRVRTERWGPRTIDLDIVSYGANTHVDEPELHVPHRELANRDFWRRELAELGAAL